ncbi:hypothetical protein Hanom_Chr00s000670g01654391 [Helianthus anomalus]
MIQTCRPHHQTYTKAELVQDVYTTTIDRMPEDELTAWWPTISDGPHTRAEEV